MKELIKKLNEYQETGAIGYSVYVDLVTTAKMAHDSIDIVKMIIRHNL